MIYALGIALIYLCKYYGEKKLAGHDPELVRKAVVLGSFTVLFLLSAFRGPDVGIDTSNYMEKFNLIRQHSFLEILTSFYTERVEIGYALLNKLVSLITSSSYLMVVINSAFVCYGMAYFVIHYTKEDITPIILFTCTGMFLQSLNVARQAIACILLLNSWGALTRGQYKITAALFLSSICFHWTSVIFAAVYFFYFFRNNKLVVLPTMLVSFVVIANYELFIRLLSMISDSYSYLDNSRNRITANGIWAIWGIALVFVAIFMVCYVTNKRSLFGFKLPRALQNPQELFCVPLFVVYYIILTYIGTKFNYFNRLGVYFMPFEILLFMNMERVLKRNSRLLHKIYIIGLHVCFIGYLLLSTSSGQFKY